MPAITPWACWKVRSRELMRSMRRSDLYELSLTHSRERGQLPSNAGSTAPGSPEGVPGREGGLEHDPDLVLFVVAHDSPLDADLGVVTVEGDLADAVLEHRALIELPGDGRPLGADGPTQSSRDRPPPAGQRELDHRLLVWSQRISHR